ncbi:hypothetical protein GLYMA_08G318051v4 [Glycine max]|nr:hypothetical protein GLYMA_08G317750v4 [Glycine max]KAG4399885.1 hypothetical protein GLYMA_08G318051v4 [Glycine max]KAH1054098.1 hypothetical protein GYH30_023055 [Glycine max]KAH1054104.1 hypothetical protein GYH30_023059 [Glycine max]
MLCYGSIIVLIHFHLLLSCVCLDSSEAKISMIWIF